MTWRTVPLPTADRERIATLKWKVFTLEQAILIAEGWNGGMSCREIAEKLDCGTQSIAMAIGPMRNAGVRLRPASQATGSAAQAAQVAVEAPLPSKRRTEAAQAALDAHLDRLRRLAPFDEPARRVLELYTRGAHLG